MKVSPHVEKPSYTCLFADDAKIGHILQSSDDIRLQLTLANIDKWMSTLQLELATSKCKVMRIGKCINKSNYYLNLLKYYTYYKGLSIIFRDNLKCYTHIFDICSKAYSISNMIFRSFMTNQYSPLVCAYLTYLRPILEYGSSVWNPHSNYIGYNDLLEKVQRNVTKKLCYRCNLSYLNYSDGLKFLNLHSLSQRRTIADLTLAFKIIKGFVDVPVSDIMSTYVKGSHLC